MDPLQPDARALTRYRRNLSSRLFTSHGTIVRRSGHRRCTHQSYPYGSYELHTPPAKRGTPSNEPGVPRNNADLPGYTRWKTKRSTDLFSCVSDTTQQKRR